jgi:hypothetical protein
LRSFYQDRLGTNTGNAPRKDTAVVSGATVVMPTARGLIAATSTPTAQARLSTCYQAAARGRCASSPAAALHSIDRGTSTSLSEAGD